MKKGLFGKNFDNERYNVKRLQVRPEDVEMNKCVHESIDEETNACNSCGTEIDMHLSLAELSSSTEIIIGQLETMKIIADSELSDAEVKACQKYFDMIPLLKNISSLYFVCNEALEGYQSYKSIIDRDEEDDDIDIDPTDNNADKQE